MLCCWRSCIVSKQPEANTTADAISSSFPPCCCCHGECVPFCVVATETPTSQPISCSHISTWSFIFLSYTTALEKQHRGAPSGVDANTLPTFPRWLVFVIVNMWCLGTVRTDWSYEGWEYQKFPTANIIHTGVFSHLFESLLHSYLHRGCTYCTSGFSCAFACVCVPWITCVHAKLLRKTRKTTNELPLSFPELHEYWGTKMHLPAGIGRFGIWLSSLIISTCLG